MASLRHPNVVMFMGLCLEPPCIVTEFCARGSLFDVLRKARSSPPFAQQLDWPKRLGMALDASKVLHAHVVTDMARTWCHDAFAKPSSLGLLLWAVCLLLVAHGVHQLASWVLWLHQFRAPPLCLCDVRNCRRACTSTAIGLCMCCMLCFETHSKCGLHCRVCCNCIRTGPQSYTET